MIATAIVLTTLGWKNQYRMAYLSDSPFTHEIVSGVYGWPRVCVNRDDDWGSSAAPFTSLLSSQYTVASWPSLLLDAFIAAVSLIVTWVSFSRSQRRYQRWRQLSLTSLFAIVMLAAVVCTVLKSEQLWGW